MFVQSSALFPLLLFLCAGVYLIFQHRQEEMRGRGRNKEWQLFLLASSKTAFLYITMKWGY